LFPPPPISVHTTRLTCSAPLTLKDEECGVYNTPTFGIIDTYVCRSYVGPHLTISLCSCTPLCSLF
jgi:hypothetical protein